MSHVIWDSAERGRAAASFSPDRTYRYQIIRRFVAREKDTRRLLGILLNPSKADAFRLDHTIVRCIDYARRWGFTSWEGLNIFALRSTDPKALYSHESPIGLMNDEIILARILDPCVAKVLVAFGVHGALNGRGDDVLLMLRQERVKPYCLGVTKDGFPVHPLRQLAALTPRLYTERP